MGRSKAHLRWLVATLWMIPTLAIAAAPQPTAKASKSGFVAMASIVTDADWKQKWQGKSTPHFHTPSKLKVGEKAWLLTFFSGAKLENGIARLKCDITIRDPDGSVDERPPQLCYEGPAPGAEMIFMTGMEVGFEVVPEDLDGLTQFEVGITDVNRDIRIPVQVSVEFVTGNHPK